MNRGRPRHPDILTPREWEVLALVERGYTNDEIASRLGLSIGGVKFHMTEILGKLHLSNRDEAARWHRDRSAPAPLWMLPLDWLRSLSIAARAVGAGVVVLTVAAVAVGAWGVSRTHDATAVTPEIVLVPPHLSSAKWMNGGEWILAFDTSDLRYKVVDRTYVPIFLIPDTVDCGAGARCVLIDVRGSASSTLAMAHYKDPRFETGVPLGWKLGEQEGALQVWDAATGEARQSFPVPPAVPSLIDTVTDSRGWRYFSDAGGHGWRNDTGREVAPTSLLPITNCSMAISGDGRFAVVRAGQPNAGGFGFDDCGACRLIDVERGVVLDESTAAGRFAGGDARCGEYGNADWAPDGRTLLLSRN